jgi:hypothetical protein
LFSVNIDTGYDQIELIHDAQARTSTMLMLKPWHKLQVGENMLNLDFYKLHAHQSRK